MFLSTKQRRSPKTAKVYEGVLNEFFAYLNYKPVKLVTYEDLINYSEWLSKPNPYRKPAILSVTTQNRKISTLKSFFKFAMKIGYIRFNPAEPLETQRVDSRVAQRIVTREELKALFEAAKKKSLLATLVVYFLASTGCRISELTGCMWRNFFYGPKGIICVNILGKGNKTRILKINKTLWNLITIYRKEKGMVHTIAPQDRSPLLINKYGNAYSTQAISKLFKEVVNNAGVREDISPHWLRHTFATEVAQDENSNIWQLKYDLGHASITTTGVYVHIARGMEKTSVDHLEYLDDLTL